MVVYYDRLYVDMSYRTHKPTEIYFNSLLRFSLYLTVSARVGCPGRIVPGPYNIIIAYWMTYLTLDIITALVHLRVVQGRLFVRRTRLILRVVVFLDRLLHDEPF